MIRPSDKGTGSYIARLRALMGSGLVHVPGTRIVIARDDERILLQKRSDFGLWDLPGGIVEDGDRAEETIVREVQEETGLWIAALQVFGFASDPSYEQITFPNGDRCHFHVLMFYTDLFGGEYLRPNNESLALSWFALDYLPEMLPNMSRSIEAYCKFRKYGRFQLI